MQDQCFAESSTDNLQPSSSWTGREDNQPNQQMSAAKNNQAAEGGSVPFVSSMTVKHLFEILNVRQSHNIEFQQFFALLQQSGEEMMLMDLNDSRQDDYVPIPVIQEFMRNFLHGFHKLMQDIGYIETWRRKTQNHVNLQRLKQNNDELKRNISK